MGKGLYVLASYEKQARKSAQFERKAQGMALMVNHQVRLRAQSAKGIFAFVTFEIRPQ